MSKIRADGSQEYANEDNWTLRQAKAFARKYDMQVAICRICDRPHVWVFGQYTQAPSTCGRDRCAVTHYPQQGETSETFD